MDDIFGAVLGGVAGTGQNIFNWVQNERADQRNYERQQAEVARLEKREDNAIQRRALDLQAAGLSKTLAAGSSASAASIAPVQKKAYQMDGVMESALIGMQVKNMSAQNDFIKAQAAQVRQATAHDIERMDIEKKRLGIDIEREGREVQSHEWKRLREELERTSIRNLNDLHELKKTALELENDSRTNKLNREELDVLSMVFKLVKDRIGLNEDFQEWLLSQTVGSNDKGVVSHILRMAIGLGRSASGDNKKRMPQVDEMINNILEAWRNK